MTMSPEQPGPAPKTSEQRVSTLAEAQKSLDEAPAQELADEQLDGVAGGAGPPGLPDPHSGLIT